MKKDHELLIHIYEDVNDILKYTNGHAFEDIVKDSMMRKAVCMSLINIGELAKSLSSAFKAEYKQIPWKSICGLRDVTAHKYHTLNLDVIWTVVTRDIPPLHDFLTALL